MDGATERLGKGNFGSCSEKVINDSPFDRASMALKMIEMHCFWLCGLLEEVWRVSTLPKGPPS